MMQSGAKDWGRLDPEAQRKEYERVYKWEYVALAGKIREQLVDILEQEMGGVVTPFSPLVTERLRVAMELPEVKAQLAELVRIRLTRQKLETIPYGTAQFMGHATPNPSGSGQSGAVGGDGAAQIHHPSLTIK